MRIYLDMCCLQRPMDNQTHFRVRMESEAILGILSWCEAGNAELLNSAALKYEVDHNPYSVRKRFVQETLAKSSLFIQVDAQADYFCTCDDKFLKRAKQIEIGSTIVVSPLELIEIIEP